MEDSCVCERVSTWKVHAWTEWNSWKGLYLTFERMHDRLDWTPWREGKCAIDFACRLEVYGYERMLWIFKYGWQLRFFFISGSRGWSGPGSETGSFCGHVCRLGGADWSRLWLRFFFVSELGGSYIVGFGFCWPCVAVPALLRLMTLRGRTGVWLCLFNYFWPCVATLIFWWTSDPVWQNAHLILVCLITFGPVWQRWFVGGLLTLCGRSWLLIVPDPTWQCILVNYLMALCGNLDFVWLSPVPTGNPCII